MGHRKSNDVVFGVFFKITIYLSKTHQHRVVNLAPIIMQVAAIKYTC